jgi:hypothetical protein
LTWPRNHSPQSQPKYGAGHRMSNVREIVAMLLEVPAELLYKDRIRRR